MRIISQQNRKSNQAFTLIEMIGVLAVIAILASMLIPKIFEAINNSKINNAAVSYSGATPTTTDSAYDLDGTGGNDASGGVVVEAVITGVTENDARDLSLRLDGDALSTAATGADDLLGRVKYALGSPTTVYIYVTHR